MASRRRKFIGDFYKHVTVRLHDHHIFKDIVPEIAALVGIKIPRNAENSLRWGRGIPT